MLDVLAEEYPIRENGEGVQLKFVQAGEPGILKMTPGAGSLTIKYGSLMTAGRGIGHALSGKCVEENVVFETLGIMLDCSRNAVMKTEYLKKWLRRLTLMGYNMVMLYCEDTYQLPDEPYFGFMRGGYSLEEMQDVDAYAARLGVEMVPCIQTLGHLEHMIRWHVYRNVTDTERVMMVDEEKTYALIEKMLQFWSSAFKSRRVHVGMDETHDLGRGRFMDKFGYERGFDLFNRHLDRVNQISKKFGYKPIIWSDMYFRMGNPDQNYYDPATVIPDDVKAKIPQDAELCYWDYYHRDEAFYSDWIQRHRDLGFEPLMGSGVWTWVCMWYDHEQTVATVTPCLSACRKAKVKDVFFTMWGDNGAYCEYDSSLAGLAWAADLSYGGGGSDDEVSPLFEAVCGGSYKDQLTACDMQPRIDWEDGKMRCFTSLMIWEDPMLGLYWREFRHFDENIWEFIRKELAGTREKLAGSVDNREAGDIGHAWNICDFLVKKIDFRSALLAAYEKRDRKALTELKDRGVPEVNAAMEKMAASFRRQWLKRNKPFGLEIMQVRFGGQIARYNEIAVRIDELLSGVVDSIPELEIKLDKPSGQIDCRYGRSISGCMI
jgi:hypothetical protein